MALLPVACFIFALDIGISGNLCSKNYVVRGRNLKICNSREIFNFIMKWSVCVYILR